MAPLLAREPVDATLQIAKRACERYEQRGRQDGRTVQDWGQAEREIRKDEPASINKREQRGRHGERMKMEINSTNSCKPLWRQNHDQ